MVQTNKFHQHLDKCKQCENNPFNLCPIGVMLLQEVGSKISEQETSIMLKIEYDSIFKKE